MNYWSESEMTNCWEVFIIIIISSSISISISIII